MELKHVGGDASTGRRFHEATKHSPESIRRRGYSLDWSNKPDEFKRYRDLPSVPLPDSPPAQALAPAAGVHHRWEFGPGDRIHFRNYASAGALYPVEAYLADTVGVFHLDPRGPSLDVLRGHDCRPWLVRAAGNERSVSRAKAIAPLTGIPWRTAWKYTERGYRHLFWDAGMVLANLLALANEREMPATVVTGFVDGEVEALIGLDGVREFPLCLVALGEDAGTTPAAGPPEPITAETLPLSPRELLFEGIREVNDAGRLADPEAVARWRRGWAEVDAATRAGSRRSTASRPPLGLPVRQVLRLRGSARRFGPEAMPRDVLERVLTLTAAPLPTDLGELTVIRAFLVANRVDGLERGAYVFDGGGLRQLRPGDFRRAAASLCLGQALGGTSAATIFLMTDLEAILDRLGDRGYRVAQLAGGIAGGFAYLGAYAQRFGATGLTFFDDEVSRFFGPEASGLSCVLVVAVGDSPRLHRLVERHL